jgi:cob(I)alamin adenosyltransferase
MKADRKTTHGLVLVHTGEGKGKTTAAFGMVLRALAPRPARRRRAVRQERRRSRRAARARPLADRLAYHVCGDGFTWKKNEGPSHAELARAGWDVALQHLADPAVQLVVLDEINIALSLGFLPVADVLAGLELRPPCTHVVLTVATPRPNSSNAPTSSPKCAP